VLTEQPSQPRFQSLPEWLAWQERLHPVGIDLGLERVGAVWRRMGCPPWHGPVITVAGTNGKGSCVALLDAILRAAGYATGCYTSPHLRRYNERIRIAGAEVGDVDLCATFARVDAARGDISLTYFEFGTLAALDLFAATRLDVILLEVGLGGRLDAVNLVDPDLALIATVDVDHTDWLGPDRATIAREKAGILRPGRPAIYAARDLPESLREQARRLAAPLYRLGADFDHHAREVGWDWSGAGQCRIGLPLPALRGVHQLDNAAAVLMALTLLGEHLPVDQRAVREGLLGVRLPGRFQVFPGPVGTVVDVAHNPQAARSLAANLEHLAPGGRIHAVFACLRDKDASGIVAGVAPQVSSWHLAQLPGERARPVAELARLTRDTAGTDQVATYACVADAWRGACQRARTGDWVLACGSFLVAGAVLGLLAGDASGSPR
jgi:dihydrofolate synthase / folylpolyglutamate synthase